MDFNFSMDLSPRPATDPNAPLYASLPGVMAHLGGGECMLRGTDGESHVMTVQVLQALDQCRSFAPLAEHVATVQSSLPKVPAEGIRRVLEGLLARRLLLVETDFVAGLARSTAGPQANATLRVLIDGGADPAAWFDALAIGAAAPRLAAAEGVWLAESAAPVAAAAARGMRLRAIDPTAAVAAIQRRLALPADQRSLLAELIGGGRASSPAQAFNLRLLIACGGRALHLGGRQSPPIHRHPAFRRGLELRPHAEYPLRFFADDDAASQAGQADDGALMAWQLDALGASVGDLLHIKGDSAWQPGDLRGVAIGELPPRIEQARVVATEFGVRGIAESGDREPWFLIDPESRVQLTQDRERYLDFLERGRVWTGARRATLVQRSEREPMALDARGLLGYAPVAGRDHALGFSLLTRLADPGAQVLRVPVATLASGPAPATLPIGKTARQPSLTQFVADFLDSRLTDIHANAPDARMHTGSALLDDLAGARDAQLIEFTAEYLQFVRSSWIGALQRIDELAGAAAPIHWRADLRAIVTANGKALVASGLPLLADLPAVDSAAALASSLRAALRHEAEHMRLWPLVWQRAAECASADPRWFV